MPVAKTYANMSIQGEPFKENGRMYVNVIAPKGLKKVRWYSDIEYQRMYPGEKIEKKESSDFDARHAFGFGELGYITIYKGNDVMIENWAEEDRTNLRYNLTFLYYTPSRLEVPYTPKGIEPIQLKWEEVMENDNQMKPHEIVQKIVAVKRDALGQSTYQGEENEWLEKEVVIRENKTYETQYGDKHTHYMVDSEGNTYVWETSAKNVEIGTTLKLKMKVKAHKEIKGEKCTLVWYCKEI